MKINALGYIGFASPKYEEWNSFGPELLGLALSSPGEDGSIRLRLDERHHRICVHPGELHELAYVGWELRGREEFELALQHLREKGVPFTLATEKELRNRCVAGMAWFYDPCQYRHEIYFGQMLALEPFRPGAPSNGFVAGDLGIGHCVLVVPKLTRALRDFATDVMGFKTFWPLNDVEIYRCNMRSHCLVYLPFEGYRGIDHFYLDNKSMDDVGRALDRCRAAGVVERDLGRYVQDDDISFYVRTPTGVNIQFAWGSKLTPLDSVNTAVMGSPLVWGHKIYMPGFGPTVHRVNEG